MAYIEIKDLENKLINAGIEKKEAEKEISILIKEFSKNNLEKIQIIVNKRIETREPIQYMLGKAYFMDFEIKVNKNVLIPRPETEILVEETVRRLNCHSQLDWESRNKTKDWIPTYAGMTKALDIGTGSGIIAIALARLIPHIKIVAIDLNQEIIALAKENAKNCGVSDKIDFKVCDLFSNDFDKLLKKNNFDLIVSNPPYVRASQLKKLSPEIYLHEPKIALSGSKENSTGLIYYERIIQLIAGKGLSRPTPTTMAFEIDPPLANDLKSLLKENGLNNYEIVKDYAKLNRCLFIVL